MGPQRTRVGWGLLTPTLPLSKPTPEQPPGAGQAWSDASAEGSAQGALGAGSLRWGRWGLGWALLGRGGLVAGPGCWLVSQHRIGATRES